MPWFKVDDQLHSHPKSRRADLPAMGLWVVAGSYCMSYKTDGFVPEWFVAGWKNGKKLASDLAAAGLWESCEDDGNKGWKFHDWEHFQPLAVELEADREAARKRQAERRDRLRKGDSHEPVTPPVTRDNQGDSQRDVPSDNRGESQHPIPIPIKESKTASADAPQKPQSIEHQITDAAYLKLNKAFNFVAVRSIVKWAIHDKGSDPSSVGAALVELYEMGKPLTKMTVGQYLDGKITRQPRQHVQNMSIPECMR